MNQMRQIRLMFVLRGAAAAILLVLLLLPTGAGVVFIGGLTLPLCGAAGSPESYGIPYQEVRIPAPSINGELRGYWIPAEGEAKGTIIAVPTGAAGRADRIHELMLFVQDGYNVLAYESRTCAARVTNSLGLLEVEQVGDALAYLAANGVEDGIGIHGFSAGGASAIMAAARFPQIDAVVAQGGYHDLWDEIEQNTAAWDDRIPLLGGLFRFGAQIGYSVMTGENLTLLLPRLDILRIAPRPVLLIYGTEEPGLRGALIMADSGGHVELWQVPGAGHGDYTAAAGADVYARTVNAFWDRTLNAAR